MKAIANPLKRPSYEIKYYGATAVAAVYSLVFCLFCGMPVFIGMVVLTVACFLTTRRLLGVIKDAQEQKNFLDEQLIQSQKLAAIGELSSGIAHEINNPLAIIGQEAEWMLHVLHGEDSQALKGLDEVHDSLQEIVRQVDRCKEITHHLLNFARKMKPLIQLVDVNKLVEDMTKLVEREAINYNINIHRHYQDDLPPLETDAPLLRQVILNLLNNAVHAIQKDGVITITTRHLTNEPLLSIEIADTGCGIPEENLSKIFDPFFTTKPPGKGTGLGLSICHGIINKLGGRILVSSTLGKGTTFTIQLSSDSGKGAN